MKERNFNEYYLLLFMCTLGLCWASPEFTEEPQSAALLAGKEHSFKCAARGMKLGNHSFVWQKNGILLTVQEQKISVVSYDISGLNITILTVKDIETNDAGLYRCVILAPGKTELRSGQARLTVQSLPNSRFPECQLFVDKILVGANIKLSCISEKVEPMVTLEWRRNKYKIRNDERITFSGDKVQLDFDLVVSKNDIDAVFTCFQTSPVRPENQSTCSVGPLKVGYKPTIVIQHTDQILPGREAILFCQTFSNPPVDEYQWAFHPTLGDNQYTIDASGQLLTLLNPSLTMNATKVTCSATNEIGKSSSTIQINIGKPYGDPHSIDVSFNHNEFKNKNGIRLSLDVVIIIAAGVVIIVVLVVLVPVYHYCLCRNDNTTAVDSSGNTVIQPEVYYEAKEGVILRHTLQDRSLPRVPTTEVYGHWRHSTASQVPNDLETHSYTYIDTEND
ncbi:cell adhesion molecule 4-like [Anneissia japonica]|uniref:cell adhesion molecule 4-like n=1 Tax=Anneissia japonica TaxID=1529436 RepID=UPI0014254F8E|nr:cell adhesion molecule 4-like [Anneissia japonica]